MQLFQVKPHQVKAGMDAGGLTLFRPDLLIFDIIE
jgi:hypothetical protein